MRVRPGNAVERCGLSKTKTSYEKRWGSLAAKHGLEPDYASTCSAAIDVAKRHKVDIVLADQNLPYGQGDSLCRCLRVLHSATRFVVMSGLAREFPASRPRHLKADGLESPHL